MKSDTLEQVCGFGELIRSWEYQEGLERNERI